MDTLNDSFLLRWRPARERPEEGSYILLKYLDEDGCPACCGAAYENHAFIFIYDRDTHGEINDSVILGWCYYPYDERN